MLEDGNILMVAEGEAISLVAKASPLVSFKYQERDCALASSMGSKCRGWSMCDILYNLHVEPLVLLATHTVHMFLL